MASARRPRQTPAQPPTRPGWIRVPTRAAPTPMPAPRPIPTATAAAAAARPAAVERAEPGSRSWWHCGWRRTAGDTAARARPARLDLVVRAAEDSAIVGPATLGPEPLSGR